MKVLISIITFLFCSLSIPAFQGVEGTDMLCRAFEDSGLNFNTAVVSGWVMVEKPYADTYSMKRMAYDIYNFMSSEDDAAEKVIDDTINSIVLKWDFPDKTMVISIYEMQGDRYEKNNREVSVEITQKRDFWNIIDIRERLVDCLRLYGANPNITAFISGYSKGRLSMESRHKITDDILDSLNVNGTDGIDEEGIMSITGFSPFVPDYIICGDSRVNINIACRYSSYDDRTYFWLGTPVISSEY